MKAENDGQHRADAESDMRDEQSVVADIVPALGLQDDDADGGSHGGGDGKGQQGEALPANFRRLGSGQHGRQVEKGRLGEPVAPSGRRVVGADKAVCEAEEKEKTGITTLRVKYTNAFGYFIEVSKGKWQMLQRFLKEYLKEVCQL